MVGVGGSSPLGRTISQPRDLVPFISRIEISENYFQHWRYAIF